MSWLFASGGQNIGASASASSPSNEHSGLMFLRSDLRNTLISSVWTFSSWNGSVNTSAPSWRSLSGLGKLHSTGESSLKLEVPLKYKLALYHSPEEGKFQDLFWDLIKYEGNRKSFANLIKAKLTTFLTWLILLLKTDYQIRVGSFQIEIYGK